MTTWADPTKGRVFSASDAVTSATPLGVFTEGGAAEAEAAEKEASGGGQTQHQAEANEPPQSELPTEKKSKGKPVKTECHDRTGQEVLAEVTSNGQA